MRGVRKPASGRPPRMAYRPELAASLRAHFETAAQTVDRQVAECEFDGLAMPTVAAWLRAAGVPRSTARAWLKRHADFAAAHAFCRQLQRDLERLPELVGVRITYVFED